MTSLNLIVIRSDDMNRAAQFYSLLGLKFEKHSHGGPEHYAADIGGVVFEIYQRQEKSLKTTGTRIGFSVSDIDLVLVNLQSAGGYLITPPTESEWGVRAVLNDLDGHKVELIEKPE